MKIKLLIEPQNFQKIHNKIIQSQLQKSILKKYLKKDIYICRRKMENYWWSDINITLTKNEGWFGVFSNK